MAKKIALLCALLIATCNAYASEQKQKWTITVAPYVWAMNMRGDVQIAKELVHVKEQFSDILKSFQGGGMLWIDATKGRFGLFANGLYAYLEKKVPLGKYTIRATTKFGLFSAGASYRIYERSNNCNKTAIEPYIGARYTLNNVKLRTLDTKYTARDDHRWVDPIIGARFLHDFSARWATILAADIGGTNNHHNSYNLLGMFSFSPKQVKTLKLYLGYRLLYQHYSTGSHLSYFDWKMHLFGPFAGLSFRF